MPRAPKVCSHHGCPNLQPCATHPPRKPWTGSTRRATLPPDWNRRRLQRFQIDNWTCVDCGHHDPTGATLECDHDGDRHDHRIENLRTRCTDRAKGGNGCHRRRTQQQARTGRRP